MCVFSLLNKRHDEDDDEDDDDDDKHTQLMRKNEKTISRPTEDPLRVLDTSIVRETNWIV